MHGGPGALGGQGRGPDGPRSPSALLSPERVPIVLCGLGAPCQFLPTLLQGDLDFPRPGNPYPLRIASYRTSTVLTTHLLLSSL